MSRLKLKDTFISAITKMSDGNPGAITALIDLSLSSPEIDPQSEFGGIGPFFSFDLYEIYGSDIYIIWNDKCGRDSRKTLMLLRAVQLGFLQESKLKEMASDQMRQVDLTEKQWEELDYKVCKEEFQKK